MFSIIFAHKNEAFGYQNKLPWGYDSEDMLHFKILTIRSIVIMGRKTYESVGSLKNRITIVITSKEQVGKSETTFYVKTFDEALKMFPGQQKYLIGGSDLISRNLNHPDLEFIYETAFTGETPGYDVAAPVLNLNSLNTIILKRNLFLTIYKHSKKNGEKDYLELMQRIIKTGTYNVNRTGINTYSLWGQQLRFDISKKFPLFTSKRVPFKSVLLELLFFLSGKTDTKVLEEQKVTIWKGNTSREYLDKMGFSDYLEGEMGFGYPHVWRHFGSLNLGEGGIDQIKYLEEGIKNVKANPEISLSRRLILSAWDPVTLNKAVLPPCHYALQFNVNKNTLNCCVNMRSGDMFLGIPFNVASYTLLTLMFCKISGLTPGELVLNITDCHVYENAISSALEQIKCNPAEWPEVKLTGDQKTIDDFKFEDFTLVGYTPGKTFKVEMAV